jgi:hypothetical protein
MSEVAHDPRRRPRGGIVHHHGARRRHRRRGTAGPGNRHATPGRDHDPAHQRRPPGEDDAAHRVRDPDDRPGYLPAVVRAGRPVQPRGGTPHGLGRSTLFLVSFFSDRPDVPFVPEELQVISQGTRTPPRRHPAGDAGLGAAQDRATRHRDGGLRVRQRGRPGIGHHRRVRACRETQWRSILPRVQAERARARARHTPEL